MAFSFDERLAGFVNLPDGGRGSGGHPIRALHRKAICEPIVIKPGGQSKERKEMKRQR